MQRTGRASSGSNLPITRSFYTFWNRRRLFILHSMGAKYITLTEVIYFAKIYSQPQFQNATAFQTRATAMLLLLTARN